MIFIYSQEDIARWSAFSGDYNPLHFSNVDTSNPVQGMMVFISIMEKIIGIERIDRHESVNLEVFFRQHLLSNKEYFFSCDMVKKRLRISDTQGEDVINGCFHCKVGVEDSNRKKTGTVSEMIHITELEKEREYSGFFSCFPDSKSYRLFLAALAFSKLIHSRTFLDLYKYHFSTLQDYLAATHTLQISQSLTFFNNFSHQTDVCDFTSDIVVTVYKYQLLKESLRKTVRLFYFDCHCNNKIILQGKTTIISACRKEEREDE